MKRQEFKGEITVFLCLVFVLLLSFIGALIQSASIHITKSMKRADTRLALESVFAEYQKDMLEEYDLFVKLDGDEAGLSRRLWFYGAENIEHRIQKIQLLTDDKGQAFFNQAVRSMGGKAPENKEVSEVPWEEKAKEVNNELDSLLQEEGQSLPTENNPIETVKRVEKSSLLSLVISEPENISNRCVVLEGVPSHRILQTGTSNFLTGSKDGASQKLLFTAYLAEHFPDYTKDKKENALLYEAEYLLEGLKSDSENLEEVLKKILLIQTGKNYAYLLTDQTKQAEAETMALTLCSLLLVPEITELTKQAILFAWAYGEGIQDLRILTEGKRVPLIKTQETWQLSLENLLKLGTDEDIRPQTGETEGMSYGDYVKVFLMAEKTERLCMRALDLVELKLGIRVDECVTAVQIKSTCEMQRKVRDTFFTEYHYQ